MITSLLRTIVVLGTVDLISPGRRRGVSRARLPSVISLIKTTSDSPSWTWNWGSQNPVPLFSSLPLIAHLFLIRRAAESIHDRSSMQTALYAVDILTSRTGLAPLCVSGLEALKLAGLDWPQRS